MRFQIIAIIMFYTSILSCKKTTNDVQCILEKQSLIGNKYKITSNTSVSFNGAVIDEAALLNACERDDITEFLTNNVRNQIDEGVVCNPSRTYSGNWDLIGQTIIFDGTVNFNVTEFNCQSFKATYTTSISGISKVQTFVFTKQ